MRLENKIFRLSSQHIANMDNRQLINKRIITIPALNDIDLIINLKFITICLNPFCLKICRNSLTYE